MLSCLDTINSTKFEEMIDKKKNPRECRDGNISQHIAQETDPICTTLRI